MANPHRGEVALEAGDRTYTLLFSVNALCELEELLARPVAAIVAELNQPDALRISTLRAMLWAGLRERHPEIEMEDAGRIATEAGMTAVGEAIGSAFQRAFPDGEVSGGTRPRKAKGKSR